MSFYIFIYMDLMNMFIDMCFIFMVSICIDVYYFVINSKLYGFLLNSINYFFFVSGKVFVK